jgi:hypothetical protein
MLTVDEIISKAPSKITSSDIATIAAILGVTPAHIKAVIAVESGGSGFFDNLQPKILFEAHLFAKETNQGYNITHPNISSAKWNKALYFGGKKEYIRLGNAMAINPEAALKSTSFGMFQILGNNFKACGCSSVDEFVRSMCVSEAEQLRLFGNFLVSTGLIKKLRANDWAGFARGYNGPGYAANKYDIKLLEAFNKG